MHYQPASCLFKRTFAEITQNDCAASVYSWLNDETSLTARIESLCETLQVQIVHEGFIGEEQLSVQELSAFSSLGDRRYWCREVQLLADGVPWLAGRTLIPEKSLNGQVLDMKQLGTQPLGKYLFSSALLRREYLITGTLGELWARRSLLHLADTSLLLTEIFLPASPLYPS